MADGTARPSCIPKFDDVVREHGEYTRGLLLRLGIPSSDLAGVTGQVFRAIEQQLCDFDGRIELRVWICGVCVRETRSHREEAYVARRRGKQLVGLMPFGAAPELLRPLAENDTSGTGAQLAAHSLDELPAFTAGVRALRAQGARPHRHESLAQPSPTSPGPLARSAAGTRLGSSKVALATATAACAAVACMLGLHFAGMQSSVKTAPMNTGAAVETTAERALTAIHSMTVVPASRAVVPAADAPTERARSRSRSQRSSRAAETDASQIEAELLLLTASRTALKRGDAERALVLAEQHLREHRRGVFAQERELLAIKALSRLEQSEQARVRAHQFLKRYARSALAARFRTYLERVRKGALSPDVP